MGRRSHQAVFFSAGLFALGCGEPPSERVAAHSEAIAVGAEITLDATEVPAPISSYASHPVLASNGTDYLAVWTADAFGLDTSLYASRVSPTGQLLDDPPIMVSGVSGGELDDRSAVASGPLGYVIIHRMYYDLVAGTSFDLKSSLLKPDGTLVENGVVVSADNGQDTPALAASGSSMLLVWADDRVTSGTNDIRARRLDAEGKPVGSELLLSNTPLLSCDRPTVVFDGSSYLVAWETNQNIQGIHVTQAGVKVEAAPLILATGSLPFPKNPALAANGTHVLFAHTLGGAVNVRRLNSAGVVVGAPVDIATDGEQWVSLGSNGNGFLAVWTSSILQDMRATRIDANGNVLDAAPGLGLSDPPATDPVVASNGNGYLTAWAGPAHGASTTQAVTTSVSNAGVVGPQNLLSQVMNRQTRVAGAFDGSAHLEVWQDHRDLTGYDVRGTRVSKSGAVLDSPSLSLVSAPGDQTEPTLAFGTDAYLLTWIDRQNGFSPLLGARVEADGTVGASSAIDPGNVFASAVAFDGKAFLVAMNGNAGNGVDFLKVRRVGLDGVPLGSAVTLGPNDIPSLGPGIAWGGYHLVVWQSAGGVRAARVTNDGVVVDTTPISLASGDFGQGTPSVAFGGGVFLVTFGETNGTLYFQRVTPDGVVLDATPVVVLGTGIYLQRSAVRFDGTDFVVAYQRNQANVGWGVDVVRIDSSGNQKEPNQFLAPSGGVLWSGVSLSTPCGEPSLVSYAESATVGGQLMERAFARFLTPDTTPTAPDCALPLPIEPPTGTGGVAGGGSGGTSTGGSGANPGTGGASATGGVGGSAGTGVGGKNDGVNTRGEDDGGGCGCRTTRTGGSAWLLALSLIALFCVRRQKRPSCVREPLRAQARCSHRHSDRHDRRVADRRSGLGVDDLHLEIGTPDVAAVHEQRELTHRRCRRGRVPALAHWRV